MIVYEVKVLFRDVRIGLISQLEAHGDNSDNEDDGETDGVHPVP